MTINSELHGVCEADCITHSENFRLWASLGVLPTIFGSSDIFARTGELLRRLDKQ
jgi:hypothetical protein